MLSTGHFNICLKILWTDGHLKEALKVLLNKRSFPAKSSTHIHFSQSCINGKSLSEGKEIPSHIDDREFTFATHPPLQNKLITMYEKCGSLENARKVFNDMTEPDVSSWNIMITAYRKHGISQGVFTLFRRMQQTLVQPDHFTFSTILPVCANLGSLRIGLQIHGKVVRCGFHSHVIVTNTLIDMYAKRGSIQRSRELFDKMPNADVVSWNGLITGYVQKGLLDEALQLFKEIPQRTVVSWTAIIAGYAQNDLGEKALEVFKLMQLSGEKADSATFASTLPACAKIGALDQGMEIHQKVIESDFLSTVVVLSALIDMYGKCGSIRKARDLFVQMPQRNVVSWNAMIVGYAQNGLVDKAMDTFKQMQIAGVKPSPSTFASVLPACAKLGALEQGMEIHQNIVKLGYLSEIAWNALIDMYAKCGRIKKACELFDRMSQRDAVSRNVMLAGYAQNGILEKALNIFEEMPQRNVISWTVMIAGYVQNGLVEEALETFEQMQLAGVKPNSTTFASILPGCAKIGALEKGIDIHQSIIESEFCSDVIVVNALIDMYAKCGSIEKARELFDKMSHRDVISWNTMITGYAQNGFCKDALELFELMKHSGNSPNHISFACVLFACSHAGLVDEGCKFLKEMSDSYCITPTNDHYVCIVDLFGRAGYLEETLNLIIKMPVKPVVFVWMCLLSACRTHKNVALGIFASTLLLDLNPKKSATYILLSNIYAEGGRWGEVQKVRRLMKDRGIEKPPGSTWIEVHKTVHAFCVGDRYHPWTQDVAADSDEYSSEMKEQENFSDCLIFLNDVDKEENKFFHSQNCEMLAIASGP